ncbi:carbohydrate sulfotransferase 15 isoform X2 [Dendrobates tinctorius]|uniref:carbohydrate sulfotransferase 15 isoform X2 n=1 Tax=Dendrobates tinctorius TaxID=92724 RepID=UPI003CC9E6FC
MPPPRSNMWSFWRNFGRRTLCSLLLAFIITVLVVASYALSGGRSDLIQALSASFSRDFAFTTNQSSTERPKETMQSIKDCSFSSPQVEKSYLDKREIQLTSRRIPTITELEQDEPHLFSVIPHQFLHSCRSPCWYQNYSGNDSSDPYGTNAYSLYAKRLRNIFEDMKQRFWSHLTVREGVYYRLRCLPHFYIIGQPKCGTTDLYDRLRLHPNVHFSVIKEPHWWTRKRFGIVRLKEPFHKPYAVEDYLDLFDMAAQKIQDFHSENLLSDSGPTDQILTGEASASTMWDNSAWSYFYDNVTNTEPPVLIQDFIHAFQPSAKFIVILRDPVERLYSDYLYFAIANKSAEDFNDKVNESLQMFESCLQASSLRSCAYNTTFSNTLPCALKEPGTGSHLCHFVMILAGSGLIKSTGPLSGEQEASVTHKQASNSRRPQDCSLGPMLPPTRQILIDFYRPYNQKLSQLLADRAYLWET